MHVLAYILPDTVTASTGNRVMLPVYVTPYNAVHPDQYSSYSTPSLPLRSGECELSLESGLERDTGEKDQTVVVGV